MRATNSNIHRILNSLFTSNKAVSWQQIMDAINDSGMRVTNWLQVRNVLQHLIDQGSVTRKKDIHSEEYSRA